MSDEKIKIDFILQNGIDGECVKINKNILNKNQISKHIQVNNLLNLLKMDGQNRNLPSLGLKPILDKLTYKSASSPDSVLNEVKLYIQNILKEDVEIVHEYNEITQELSIKIQLFNLGGEVLINKDERSNSSVLSASVLN